MKTNLLAVSLLLASFLNVKAGGGDYCNLMRYWPMHNGDTLSYTSAALGNGTFSYSGWGSDFSLSETFSGSRNDFSYSNGQLLLTAGNALGYNLDFSPPLVQLTDKIAESGGTFTSQSYSTLYSYDINLTLKVTVSVVSGNVTVPAGSFSNCRKLDMSLGVNIPGVINKTVPMQAFYLAPGVGPIKVAAYEYDSNLNSRLLGWADLTGGTMGGVDVATLADLTTNLPPKIATQPKSLTATNHSAVSLSVTATGTAPFGYQWYRGAQALTNDLRISGADGAKLTIQDVQFSDAATYSIEIDNIACSVSSTGAVLNVVADTLKPTLTIVSPKPNQRCSNCVFTVTGTSKDNACVSSVLFSLNGNTWICASGTTNWSASLELKAGTNSVRVCAYDLNGNSSVTSSVAFVYVLSDRLKLQVEGKGTVTPNYDGQFLEIGRSYSVAAKAATGYAFNYWGGDILTNSSTLKFQMQSNLTLIAKFRDITRPICLITAPKANQKWSNAVITVTGKTSDNAGVSNVWWQLNGGGWNAATVTPGSTNWSVGNLALIAGTNLVQAFAVDGAGNVSLTNSIKFLRVVVPDFALDSLAGKSVSVQGLYGPMTVSFGSDTFSQMSPGTNINSGVGVYKYSKSATNCAELVMTFTAPPTMSNEAPDVLLTFTNWTGGFFTNVSGDGGSGKFSIQSVTAVAPASLAGRKIVASVKGGGSATVILGTNNTFTVTSSSGPEYGNYTYQVVSPVGAMLTLTYTDPSAPGAMNYIQVMFSSAKAGSFVNTLYYGNGDYKRTDTGTFVVQ